jgi:hypothetical protein
LPAGWCITDRASFVALQFRKREQAVRQAKSKEDADAVAQNSETPGARFVVSHWHVGSEAFRQDLLVQVQHQAGPCHVGEEVYQSAQAKAEGIVREELEALGWSALDLERHRKGDPAKLKIAERLRNQTTMTLDWIAQRLPMGSVGHLSHLLYRKRPSTTEGKKERSLF